MMRPARITPSMTARLLRLKSQSRIEAARAPVQAPVPGKGMPTNRSRAQKIPLSPAAFSNFCPPRWPLLRHQLKKPPIIGFFAPQVRIWRAKKKIRGTGRRFPITPIRSAVHNGIPFAMAKGIAPRNSTRGTMEIRKVKIYFISQAFRLVFFILSYLFSIDNYDLFYSFILTFWWRKHIIKT